MYEFTIDRLPAVMMTTAQKRPISASDSPNWFMRRANPNTESIRNLAFPGGIWVIVSFRIKSPLRQMRAYNRRQVNVYFYSIWFVFNDLYHCISSKICLPDYQKVQLDEREVLQRHMILTMSLDRRGEGIWNQG